MGRLRRRQLKKSSRKSKESSRKSKKLATDIAPTIEFLEKKFYGWSEKRVEEKELQMAIASFEKLREKQVEESKKLSNCVALTADELKKMIEDLGGKILYTFNRWNTINIVFIINGVRTLIYPKPLYPKYTYLILADNDKNITTSEDISTIGDIIKVLPNKEKYHQMKETYENNRKRWVYGSIEDADTAIWEKTMKFLSKKGVVFINEYKHQFWVGDIPVELIYWNLNLLREENKYIIYVLDPMGAITEISYYGYYEDIVTKLPSKEEYNARFGVEGKSAAFNI